MARVAVDHPDIDGNNPISGHRFTFQFNTINFRAQLTQLQSTLSQQMNKPTSNSNPVEQPFASKPSKETSLHHPKKHPQAILQQPH